MPELIDKDALRYIESDKDAYTGDWNDDYEKGFCDAINKALELPTIEPEVRHGRWVHHNGGYSDHFECTACGEDIVLTGKWRFCPNCGARMDGVIEYEGH